MAAEKSRSSGNKGKMPLISDTDGIHIAHANERTYTDSGIHVTALEDDNQNPFSSRDSGRDDCDF